MSKVCLDTVGNTMIHHDFGSESTSSGVSIILAVWWADSSTKSMTYEGIWLIKCLLWMAQVSFNEAPFKISTTYCIVIKRISSGGQTSTVIESWFYS